MLFTVLLVKPSIESFITIYRLISRIFDFNFCSLSVNLTYKHKRARPIILLANLQPTTISTTMIGVYSNVYIFSGLN